MRTGNIPGQPTLVEKPGATQYLIQTCMNIHLRVNGH
jgi:hypothetical protein